MSGTLREQLDELNKALTAEHQAKKRPRGARPAQQDETTDEPRATHWNRIGARERLKEIAALLGIGRWAQGASR